MRILIEQSGYQLDNMGDLAMLQVAVARLNKLWPDALIEVFTTAPDRLTKFCPDARPMSLSGLNTWLLPLSQRLYQLIPGPFAQHLLESEWKLRHRSPSLVRFVIDLKRRTLRLNYKNFDSFIETINDADLVVAAGGGYITDTFEKNATRALSVLSLAIKLGKPTVMLGQGLGPLQNPQLRTKAKAVLPHVDLISLRERRAGIPVLDSLGTSPNRVITTGDDAIELAYNARSTELGNAIGVNLRTAKYAGMNTDILGIVRSALQDFAREKDTPLFPVPISHNISTAHEAMSDTETIQQLLTGYNDNTDGGQSLDTPIKVIEQIGHCRVVVTGSYHAGVFALAQGIPVVGLAKSEYYQDKFLGLAEQFEIGCNVVLLDGDQLREKLITSVDRAWRSSEEVRPQLLESARRQINLGHDAYRQVYELVESRQAMSASPGSGR